MFFSLGSQDAKMLDARLADEDADSNFYLILVMVDKNKSPGLGESSGI